MTSLKHLIVSYCKYTSRRIGVVDGPFPDMSSALQVMQAIPPLNGEVHKVELDRGLCPTELTLALDIVETNPAAHGYNPYDYIGAWVRDHYSLPLFLRR